MIFNIVSISEVLGNEYKETDSKLYSANLEEILNKFVNHFVDRMYIFYIKKLT